MSGRQMGDDAWVVSPDESMDRSLLTLAPASTEKVHGQIGSEHRAPREYLDFVVDGSRLLEMLLVRIGDVDSANDYASVLGTNWPVDLMSDEVAVLLGSTRSGLADGRVPLYVCAECGGLGCGTVSARVERTEDTVTWFDFGWQTDYDPFVDLDPFTEVGPIRFARETYEAALLGLL